MHWQTKHSRIYFTVFQHSFQIGNAWTLDPSYWNIQGKPESFKFFRYLSRKDHGENFQGQVFGHDEQYKTDDQTPVTDSRQTPFKLFYRQATDESGDIYTGFLDDDGKLSFLTLYKVYFRP